ncbi:hypothetical protein AgCh_033928 [Apium graveolens]
MVKKSPAYKNRLRALELERSGGVTNKKKSNKHMLIIPHVLDNKHMLPIKSRPSHMLWKTMDEQLLDDLDKYFDMDSKQSFSDGSTYSWDALPINELDVKQSTTI